ncbi:radical SAM/SPASM domain-containing protein [Candidatus Omnitrophota bacterium]
MALVIRNKNKHIYNIKSNVRKFMHCHPIIRKGYLKLKEIYIRHSVPSGRKNVLFQKIFIETVSYCNNDCEFCPASTTVKAKKAEDFMSENLYMKILNELRDISFTGSVAFHCNNEPLLDVRLVSWVKKARTLLEENFFYLYTNGMLINMKLANDLFDAGLNRIIIDNYNDKHEPIPAVKDLLDHKSFLKGELIVSYRHKNDYLGNRAGQSQNARFFLKDPLNVMCIRPSKEIVIGYDGSVPLCCADGLWKMKMGNVQETDLKTIWFSNHFKNIRRSLLQGDRSCAAICNVCDALNFSSPKGI